MKDKIDVKDEGYPSEQLNWIAMSILSQMPPIKEKAISKKEYNENGASILDKKLIYF
jgi:actin-related protein